MCVITGEVGAGKSIILRYVASKLHPSKYRTIPVIASTGSTLEVLRQICVALDTESRSNSTARLTQTIRSQIIEISQRKQVPVLIIDEAGLLRYDVLAQIQTIAQFEFDSKPLLTIIFAGQNNLLDKFEYHTSKPMASRVVARSHLGYSFEREPIRSADSSFVKSLYSQKSSLISPSSRNSFPIHHRE
ncbi:MAG: ATP-binding protein [Acidobacteria bacterium]|nr:ATP-binding protein [Acidobacteriota bacterium]